MIKKANLYIVFGLVLSFVGLFCTFALPLDFGNGYVYFHSHGEVAEKGNLIGAAINAVGVLVLFYGLLLSYFEMRKENAHAKAPIFLHSHSE